MKTIDTQQIDFKKSQRPDGPDEPRQDPRLGTARPQHGRAPTPGEGSWGGLAPASATDPQPPKEPRCALESRLHRPRPAGQPARRHRPGGHRAGQGGAWPPTGAPSPAMAASTRRWPTAPTRSTGWTSRSSRAARRSTTGRMLPAGKVDFLMTGNMLMAFDNIKQKVPTVVVAAYFQNDPQAIIAHPRPGLRQVRRPRQGQDRAARQGRPDQLLAVDEEGLRRARRAGAPLQLQPVAVPGRQAGGAAGLCDLGAAGGREAGRLQAGGAVAGRRRLVHLRHGDRDAPGPGEDQARAWCAASSRRPTSATRTTSTATARRPTR